jgi:hypothetical protein
VLTAASVGAATLVVLQSESRSGLMALALSLAAFPVAAAIRRHSKDHILRQGGAILGGVVAGIALSLAAGGAAGTAGRVSTGIATSDSSESTRFELWKGTASTIAASPVWGHGPDSLARAFPRHRPAGLSGAFRSYDLVAQSSHNWALDIAANGGLVAVVLFFGLLGRVAWRSVRDPAGDGDLAPFLWPALVGYVALTMMNPLSLAAHVTFFVLVGLLAGRAEAGLPESASGPFARFARPAARMVLVAPAIALLLVAAVSLPLADWHAQRGWDAYATGNFARAAERYGDAAGAMPFERVYQQREANSWLADGIQSGAPSLGRAAASFQVLDDRFGFISADALGMAATLIGLHRPAAEVTPFIDRAVALNPQGHSTVAYGDELRIASAQGGVLLYSRIDRWVYVEAVR